MKSLIIAAAVLALGIGVANAAADRGGTSGRYSVGTGEAHVGDGSDPGYFTPRFSGGTAAARIGDGSDPGYLDTQRHLLSAPGWGGGNG
jgi:opacity protein-like surface antigen